jgi:hypothetical protein
MQKGSWTSSIGLPAAGGAGTGDVCPSCPGAGTINVVNVLWINVFFVVLTSFLTSFDEF